MDKIARLRQEIERRMKELGTDWIGTPAAGWAFSEILTFLDTLSEEPDKSLEEEITRWLNEGDITDTRFDDYDDSDIERTARHFAEWQASQMPMPEDTVLFNKGVAEGRRLEREDMMEDAVETEVWNYSSDEDLRAIPLFGIDKFNNLKDGDKVRIVVLKEEE